jgi:large subunit ribosomal protein L21
MDVTGVQPGQAMTLGLGPQVYGYPLTSFDQLPAGDYYVQALLNVYTTFHRSDGSVVSLHLPGGDGNDLFISPGNLVSTPVLLHLDPAKGGTFKLQLDQVLLVTEDGGEVRVGTPLVENARVKGEIVRQGKAKKVLVFKKKRRKNYRRKQGHRQLFTAVQIQEIIV